MRSHVVVYWPWACCNDASSVPGALLVGWSAHGDVVVADLLPPTPPALVSAALARLRGAGVARACGSVPMVVGEVVGAAGCHQGGRGTAPWLAVTLSPPTLTGEGATVGPWRATRAALREPPRLVPRVIFMESCDAGAAPQPRSVTVLLYDRHSTLSLRQLAQLDAGGSPATPFASQLVRLEASGFIARALRCAASACPRDGTGTTASDLVAPAADGAFRAATPGAAASRPRFMALRQARLRLASLSSVPSALLRLRRLRHALATGAAYATSHAHAVAVAAVVDPVATCVLDAALGIAAAHASLASPDAVVATLGFAATGGGAGSPFAASSLRAGLDWLMGLPVGLRLNHFLGKKIGGAALTVVDAWELAGFVRPSSARSPSSPGGGWSSR